MQMASTIGRARTSRPETKKHTAHSKEINVTSRYLTGEGKHTETLIQKVLYEERIKKPQVCTEHEYMQDGKDNNSTIPACLRIVVV